MDATVLVIAFVAVAVQRREIADWWRGLMEEIR